MLIRRLCLGQVAVLPSNRKQAYKPNEAYGYPSVREKQMSRSEKANHIVGDDATRENNCKANAKPSNCFSVYRQMEQPPFWVYLSRCRFLHPHLE